MGLVQVTRTLAVLLIVFGLGALVAPGSVADFAGLQIEPSSGNGFLEIGAAFGGVTVALGAIALYATFSMSSSASALLAAVGAVFVAGAAGRLIVGTMTAPVPPMLTGWLLILLDASIGVVFLLSSRAVASEM
jgi:hypothetical protein